MAFKSHIPWWAKVGIKVLLSNTPIPHRFWQRLNLFVHGSMDCPEYAMAVVEEHLSRVGWPDLRDRVVLELGPGDSLATALIGKTLGARRTILVDAGAFATTDLTPYCALAELLRARGFRPPPVEQCTTVQETLALCDGVYLTGGLSDLRSLPDFEADLIFSQAVLEHIRSNELEPTLKELFRIARPGGVASHQVDLRDHLGGALNHLRFSDRLWEAEWMARSGFYTNRVQYGDMLAMFERTGWQNEVTDVRKWDSLPTPQTKMAPRFEGMSETDLSVIQFDIVARRPTCK